MMRCPVGSRVVEAEALEATEEARSELGAVVDVDINSASVVFSAGRGTPVAIDTGARYVER
jgi:hypothetical protein